MTRPGPRKSSCNAGELMEDLKGRPDIKQYYSGGLRYKHIEPVPQSGFRLMAGSDDIAPVRSGMADVTASIVSTDLTHSAPGTVREIAFAATAIEGVAVDGFSSDANAFAFTIELQIGGNWSAIGAAMAGSADAVSRFFAFAPGLAQTATGARLRVTPTGTQTFTLGGLVAKTASGAPIAPRYVRLPVDKRNGYMAAVGNGFVDIWNKTDWVACALTPTVTAAMVPDLGRYGELATIGLFHPDLEPVRVRRAGSDWEWTVDAWPFSGIPDHDYGGDYPKTTDVWEVFLRWTNDYPFLALQVTVDGETTQAVFVPNSAGDATRVNDSPDWGLFSTRLADEVNALPSIAGGVEVTSLSIAGSNNRVQRFRFAGASDGQEYDFTAIVPNTADASALPTHIDIGDTAGEPLISAARGWPGELELFQDRAIYLRMKGEPGALLMSEAAEYFTLNIESIKDTAARFDRLRGSGTSVEILHVKEARYLLVFTNVGVWFVNNRVINRNEPPNFVITSEVGIAPGTDAVELEGLVYYVSEETETDTNEFPGQIYSLNYDDVSTRFADNPESLLAAHLIRSVRRTARQTPRGERDTARMWLLRADGRLVCAKMIRNQEILGLCEWVAAGGAVKDMAMDHFNHLWMAVERDGTLCHERMEESTWFRQTVYTATDLAGAVTGLPFPDGAKVWAEGDGFVYGPLIVASGAVELPAAHDAVKVGYWDAPVYEGMPHVFVNRNEEIVRRPGRISSAYVDLIDTTSIAIGANGEPATDEPLLEVTDPLDAPMPAKTKMIERHGMLGVVTDPTLVITQAKPGSLHVRSYSVLERL